MVRHWIASLGLLAAGCATQPKGIATIEPAPARPAWMQAATPAGIAAIEALDDRLAAAVLAVPRTARARVAKEGALLHPAAAEPAPQLPPGPYHCRLVRLGGRRAVQTFAPDLCFVVADGDRLAFTKKDGENRPEGYLYAGGARRLVMLGTARGARDQAGLHYGQDPTRDVVGLVERVAAFRWRMVLDRGARTPALDLYELVPVTPAVPGAKPMVAAY